VPVQSGSDAVLDAMKRKYHRKDFETVCDYLLEHVPRLHLVTDFICGFPGETDADHAQSMALLKHYSFPGLNISQFYARPKTPAAKMKQLDSKVRKQRSREMTVLWKSYVRFADRVGERHNVLVTEMAKDGYHLVGHNKAFGHFLVPPAKDQDLMGKVVAVEIKEVGKFFIKSSFLHTSDTLWVSDGVSEPPQSQSRSTDTNNSYSHAYTAVMITLICLIALFSFLVAK